VTYFAPYQDVVGLWDWTLGPRDQHVSGAHPPGTKASWTAVLYAVRLGPDEEIAVPAAQVRDVIARLVSAGHWQEGDPAILVIFDAATT
jgi:hypothetical protein